MVSIKQPKALLSIPRSFRPRALLILALVGALLLLFSIVTAPGAGDVTDTWIVLFGHSEGGLAIATSAPPAGIGGLIISGWTCHSLVALGRGIAAPPSIPLLALGFEQDTTVGITQGRCSEFFPDRDGAKELILNGAGHQAGGSAEARQAVVNFLGGLR